MMAAGRDLDACESGRKRRRRLERAPAPCPDRTVARPGDDVALAAIDLDVDDAGRQRRRVALAHGVVTPIDDDSIAPAADRMLRPAAISAQAIPGGSAGAVPCPNVLWPHATICRSVTAEDASVCDAVVIGDELQGGQSKSPPAAIAV